MFIDECGSFFYHKVSRGGGEVHNIIFYRTDSEIGYVSNFYVHSYRKRIIEEN